MGKIQGAVPKVNKIIRMQTDLENFKFPPPTTKSIPYLEHRTIV